MSIDNESTTTETPPGGCLSYFTGQICSIVVFKHYCLKTLSDAINSHVLTSTNPCRQGISLLMHKFGTFNTHSEPLNFTTADPLIMS